jgi:hypothetical protein
MRSVVKTVSALLFIVAVANAGHQALHVYKSFPPFIHEDRMSHADRVFERARNELAKIGATRLSYRLEPGATFEQKATEYYIAQYALAPIVVQARREESPWLLVNYSTAGQRLSAPDLTCIEYVGWGLAVYKKTSSPATIEMPDLGTVWHEQEGEWMGTWTRRGLSNIFDAVWKNADGREIRDEIVYEFMACQWVVLYRKGANGRYQGHLSADGTRIENGQADWFSPADLWSATIDKAQ